MSSRKQILQQLLVRDRSFAFDQVNRSGLGATERKTAFELNVQLGHVTKDLAAAHSVDQVLEIESDRVRPLSHALRRFGLRDHLTLARPLWGWPRQATNPNSVSFTGTETIAEALKSACNERRLHVAEASTAGGAGPQRWNLLRSAPVGVFDLTGEDCQTRGRVCYALGHALALGIYPVIVAAAGYEVPFNLDFGITWLPEGGDAAVILGEALDQAFHGFIGASGGNSAQATARQVLSLTDGASSAPSVLTSGIASGRTTDPLEIEAVLELLIDGAKRGESALLLPVWPAAYPDPERGQCFHVMPFSQPWSNGVRETVRQACSRSGTAYRRGDETGETRVVESIWKEISQAGWVVVDLTGLNPNVCLELGLADALGRPSLLLRRAESADPGLFPEIRRNQVKAYRDDELFDLVSGFLVR